MPGLPVLGRVRGEQLAHAHGVLAGALGAGEPGLEVVRLRERLDALDLQAGALEQLAPFLLGVVADVRRVAQLLGRLDLLGGVLRVLDDDHAVRHARQLAHRRADVAEVVRRDACHDHVERAVGERQILRGAEDVRLHARRGIGGHDLGALLAQPARDVAAAGRDVEHLHALVRVAHLDDDVEVGVRRVRRRLAVRSSLSSSTRRSCGQLHGLLGRVEHRRLDVEVRRRGVREDLPALLGVRAVEADDDRRRDLHALERFEDAARDLVAARDPAEDVEEDRLHLRVLRDHLERVDDALGAAAAAEVAEVRGLAAGDDHDVDRRHREPGAVAEDADRAVELDVGDALLARERLERVGGARVAELRDVGMTVERAVVDRELRVERLHLAVGRHDQRVDLGQHRVGLDEAAIELLDDRGDLLLLGRIVDAGAVDEPPRDPGLEALERIDVQAHERVGVVRGDLLDLDAALRREHEERLLRAAVERDREVVLLRDVGGAARSRPSRRRGRGCRARGCRAPSAPRLRDRSASLTPPALPRPPVSTCALTTTGPPSSSAAARASSGVVASRPSETGMPNCWKSCLPWYS